MKEQPPKMIRRIIHFVLMLFINSILLIFKKINVTFKFLSKRNGRFERNFKIFLEDYRRSIEEGLIALLICAVGDLIAGIMLGNMTFFLETYPGLLVLIPGAIGMRGNIFGSFGFQIKWVNSFS